MKENKKRVIITLIIIALIIISVFLGYKLYTKNQETITANENLYNHSLYEVIDYMQDVQNYLAKATISTDPRHGAETLTNLWREANLAQAYMSMLPVESQEIEKTSKFLNQVSDYSYALSRKNIKGEKLTDEDFKNLDDLYSYSVEVTNTINQIAIDLNAGNISWNDLTKNNDLNYAQQVSSNINIGSNLEESFKEYSGLIYDGAFSDHITNKEKKGLKGKDISEDEAKEKVERFLGKDLIEEINSLGFSEDAEIPSYTFTVNTKKLKNVTMTISKTGGHIVYFNSNRDIFEEKISNDQAKKIGLKFLKSRGIENMKDTYCLKENGVVTVNYAYKQGDVLIYPDLVKLKIALDDGEILGMETSGYINNHHKRNISNIKITKDQAKATLNKKLDIKSEGLAIIPTEWKSEILCYEFKGKVDDIECLVYINAKTGAEEDILLIVNTPNGTLTM